jgi:hypothetical protein
VFAQDGKVLLKIISMKDVEDDFGYPQCEVGFTVTNNTDISWRTLGYRIRAWWHPEGDYDHSPGFINIRSLGIAETRDVYEIFEDSDLDLPCEKITSFSFTPNDELHKRSVKGKKFKNNNEAFKYFSNFFSKNPDPSHDTKKFRKLFFDEVRYEYYLWLSS